jgi:hypothetical protein
MKNLTGKHKEALRSLIEYRLPIEPLLAELRGFGWDSGQDLVIFESADISKLLQRYLDGHLTPEQVTDWADLIECREDIGFRVEEKEFCTMTIFRLANPNINGVVNLELAKQIQIEIATF